MWLDNEKLEDLGIDHFLHGNCDEWVLDNFTKGDIAIIWNEYDEDIGKVILIHCYLKRGNVFIDVRGETVKEELIEEGFDYGGENSRIYCKSLNEYKKWIRKICGYKIKKWQ